MQRRALLSAIGASMVAVSGCLGPGSTDPGSGDTDTPQNTEPPTDTSTPTNTSTPTETSTPPSQGEIDFPQGPKAPPQRPGSLTESAVREYVKTYEYRYAYNSLWLNQYTEVTLDCRVDSVSNRDWGYEAVVTCSGYANTNPPEKSTATRGPHADWFTQSFRYRVSDDVTQRLDAENRDPVD